MQIGMAMRLLRELHQRRVLRVGLAYLVVGWAIIEVADTVFPYIGIPGWAVRWLIVLVGLGLPVAVVGAWAFQLTPVGLRREPWRATGRAAPASRAPARRTVAWTVIVTAACLVGAGAFWLGRASLDVDDGVVAVAPFRTAGAAPELSYLAPGLADLLSVAFTGEVGPRAVDPRVVLNAVGTGQRVDLPADQARALARRLGAGHLIVGEVVGRPAAVTITASLTRSVGPGRASVASVTGPVDSLPALVQALAARLIGLHAGEGERRIAALEGTPLPAIRSYLRGQAAYRAARYPEALEHYRAALEADSTFALAALGFRNAAVWDHDIPPSAWAALELAWRHGHRLPPRERDFVHALLGTAYPDRSTYAEQLPALEALVTRAPDWAEAWFEYGDFLLHRGTLIDACEGGRGCAKAARASFERAHRLAPDWNTPLVHLVDVAFALGDSANAVELGRQLLARSPGDATAFGVQVQIALLQGDTARLRHAVLAFAATPGGASGLALMVALGFDARHDAAMNAMDAAIAAAATDSERITLQSRRHRLGRNLGRTAVAEDALDALERLGVPRWQILRQHVLDAIYWDGDPTRAARAASELAALQSGDVAPETRGRIACAVGQWWAATGDAAALRSARAALTPLPDGSRISGMRSEACTAVLDAALAYLLGDRDFARRLERADSVLGQGPPITERNTLNMLLAGLYEAAGRPTEALRCARRQPWDPSLDEWATWYHQARARHAAEAGELAESIDAYRAYLNIRADPDPRLAPERDRMRRELAAMIGEG
jgi:tetratricopeptide (TPR) repeat protein